MPPRFVPSPALPSSQIPREWKLFATRHIDRGRWHHQRARCVAHGGEAGHATALRLVRIDGEGVGVQAAGVGHVVLAAAHGALHPGVHHVKCERGVDANAGVQAAGWVPRLVAHTGYKLTHGAGVLHGQCLAVAGNHVAAFVHAGHPHFHALQAGVHIAGSAPPLCLLHPSHARAPVRSAM